MKPEWHDKAWAIHNRFVRIAQEKGELNTESEIVRFLALALCGEAGELANLLKKQWRGDSVDLAAIRDEIADVRIYLNHLARHLALDVDEACIIKLRVVEKRLEDAA